MSSSEKTQTACPKCHQSQEFENWHSVNVTLQPELKGRVLSGDLFTLTCSRCGEETTVEKTLLYCDMGRALMICLSKGLAPAAEPLKRFANPASVKLRWVETPAHLSEKIRIFDDELDDRLIEVQKILLENMVREELRDEPLGLLYDGQQSDRSGERQMEFLAFFKKSVRKLTFPFEELYAEGVRQFGVMLPDPVGEAGQWLKVDRAYAQRWLDSLTPGA